MTSSSTIKLTFLIGFLAFPLLLQMLASSDVDHGLIWFFIEQIYYLPISWIGQPFFQPDPEVGYWVLPYGCLLTMVVYATLLILFSKLVRRRNTHRHES